jgi:hypothetical protein
MKTKRKLKKLNETQNREMKKVMNFWEKGLKYKPVIFEMQSGWSLDERLFERESGGNETRRNDRER